ncbi:putative methyltransferase-like protein 7A [Nematostella vectensis]|uniref:putative methyltransferase-like protein 7A n=1 Tax=Nematostella vectensis TaxID=45351 RepID=UPI002076FFA9|nr:putative methyltransferase-like protein 7A [Nematostella vectensis]
MGLFTLRKIGLVVIGISAVVGSGLSSRFLDTLCSSSAYKSYFATLIKMGRKYQGHSQVTDMDKTMFKGIKETAEQVGGDVLEIGSGTGNALRMLSLPKGSEFIALDPNPHMEKHFREELDRFPDVKLKAYLVQGGEDLSGIASDSLAVVFVCDVLCSVPEDSLDQLLGEVKRVLKPGGRFYFIEHIADESGTWRRSWQRLLSSQLGVWPRLFGNCHCDRDTDKAIQMAGFRELEMEKAYLSNEEKSLFVRKFMYFIAYFVSGNAKK